jgi:hypothetical protein
VHEERAMSWIIERRDRVTVVTMTNAVNALN